MPEFAVKTSKKEEQRAANKPGKLDANELLAFAADVYLTELDKEESSNMQMLEQKRKLNGITGM